MMQSSGAGPVQRPTIRMFLGIPGEATINCIDEHRPGQTDRCLKADRMNANASFTNGRGKDL